MNKLKISKIVNVIEVSYEADLYFTVGEALDNKVIALAKKHHGAMTGSGLGFGRRDLTVEFETRVNAEKFVTEALDVTEFSVGSIRTDVG